MQHTNKDVAEFLNNNENITEDLSDDETIEVLGIKLKYSEDSDMHSEDVDGSLSNRDIVISRKGRKELSYGNWTGTLWVSDWD